MSQAGGGERSAKDVNTANYQKMESDEEADLAEKLAQSLSAVSRQYAAQPNVEKRIYIVGTGSIGKLVAHSLRGVANPPPITLILHRHDLLHAWEKSDKVITVQDNEYVVPVSGFDVELAMPDRRQHGVSLREGAPDIYSTSDETGLRPHDVAGTILREREIAELRERGKTGISGYNPLEMNSGLGGSDTLSQPITNLIVATKIVRTISALSAIKHRLSRESTICFLQNGMGIVDEVNKEIFQEEATRPNYIQGIVSHGANVSAEKAAQDPFFVTHAGHGTIALGIVPRGSDDLKDSESSTMPTNIVISGGKSEHRPAFPSSARYMIRTLTRIPVLCAVGYTAIELLQLQLEKLAVNSIVNPLTSLLDARNGALLYNFALARTMRLMLAETSLVIRSLPELRGIPNVPHRFSPERLETLVVGTSEKTKDNISSMLADMRSGRKTEIDYINGYIVRRGEELGIKCVVNYAIMQVVNGKMAMLQREYNDFVPIERQLEGMNRE